MFDLKSEIDYFRQEIKDMPHDVADPWPLLDPGPFPHGFKKTIGINEFENVLFPEIGSEQNRFQNLMWHGTWESLADIQAGKAKKLKFLNDIKDVKAKYLACLDFIEVNGYRRDYWSKKLDLPEDEW